MLVFPTHRAVRGDPDLLPRPPAMLLRTAPWSLLGIPTGPRLWQAPSYPMPKNETPRYVPTINATDSQLCTAVLVYLCLTRHHENCGTSRNTRCSVKHQGRGPARTLTTPLSMCTTVWYQDLHTMCTSKPGQPHCFEPFRVGSACQSANLTSCHSCAGAKYFKKI